MNATEFEFIEKFLKAKAGKRSDVILGIGDDCALLKPPDNEVLAVSTDTLVENIHFLPATPAFAVGHKALAVSLSDLAAMGAKPAWVLLSLTLPEVNEKWLADFCEGFFQLLDNYSLQLVGGNTSKGPLTITTQVIGFVPENLPLRRDGAKPGDFIYVTGQLGDAGLALRILRQHSAAKLNSERRELVVQKLNLPEPKVAIGLALRGIASAAIDISDGLAADLEHILESSKVGASIIVEQLPLSEVLATAIEREEAWHLALTAGDDYQLCFTVPPDKKQQLQQVLAELNCDYSCIGYVDRELNLKIRHENGDAFKIQQKGYRHF